VRTTSWGRPLDQKTVASGGAAGATSWSVVPSPDVAGSNYNELDATLVTAPVTRSSPMIAGYHAAACRPAADGSTSTRCSSVRLRLAILC